MPKWGLTRAQRESKPWGLDETLLLPGKTITDPIHGEIYVTRLEQAVLDSPPLQRLRRVRQLGTTHLVYPGATQSRFSHSLGTLRAAQDLLDAVIGQGLGPDPVEDLFAEWREPATYNRKIAEAVVLARLGALLHDLCHVPFGHTVEDDLGILESHDSNAARFESLWGQLKEATGSLIPDGLSEALVPMVLSKDQNGNSKPPVGDYPFVADIVGNTICADLLDYLPRDHAFTGLPAKLGRRFVDSFYVTPSDVGRYSKRMVVRLTRGSRVRVDVVTELLKFLRYRYELSERALYHHAKLAADAMVGALFARWLEALTEDHSGEADREKFARQAIETELLQRGDDGLLEWLYDEAERRGGKGHWEAVRTLARDLLDRRLYKVLGECREEDAKDLLCNNYPSSDARRELEAAIARYAGIAEDWKIVLWIPPRHMRLKAADVLAFDGSPESPIARLRMIPPHNERAQEIYKSHDDLWTMRVYAHPSLRLEPGTWAVSAKVALAKLNEKLGGVAWVSHGNGLRIEDLAADAVVEARTPPPDRARVRDVAKAVLGKEATFSELVDRVETTIEESEAVGSIGDYLREWLGGEDARYAHEELANLIKDATDSLVHVGNEVIEISSGRDIGRLNLRLHLRDIPPEDFTGDHSARALVLVSDESDRVYQTIRKFESGGPRELRANDDGSGSNPPALLLKRAIDDLLRESGRLL